MSVDNQFRMFYTSGIKEHTTLTLETVTVHGKLLLLSDSAETMKKSVTDL